MWLLQRWPVLPWGQRASLWASQGLRPALQRPCSGCEVLYSREKSPPLHGHLSRELSAK